MSSSRPPRQGMPGSSPPRSLERAIAWGLRRGDASESILGDLRVDYERKARELGRNRARLWYLWQTVEIVVRYRRPGAERAIGGPRRTATFADALRFALRRLWRNPGFTSTAVATVCVTIAANVLVIALIDAIVLEPLPYPDADRLVAIRSHVGRNATGSSVSLPDLLDWDEGVAALDVLAGFGGGSAVLDLADQALRFGVVNVTPGYFDVLGVAPALGRAFTPDEHRDANDAKVVILSDRVWRAVFGGDPAILGRQVGLDGLPATIVGIMPADHWDVRTHLYSLEADLWRPLTRVDPQRDERCCINAVGRLRAGASLESAQAEVDAVVRALEQRYPGTNRGWSATLAPLADRVVGETRAPLTALGAMAFLVLAIGVWNLMTLAVISERRFAPLLGLQRALGASDRQLVVEGSLGIVVPVVLGGLAGIASAWAALPRLGRLLPWSLPGYVRLGLDGRGALAGLALLFLATLVVGAVPWLARRFRTSALPRSRTIRGVSPRVRLTLRVLVVAEASVAFVVLLGAGLLVRSIQEVTRTELGYDAAGRMQFNVWLHAFQHADPSEKRRVARRLQDEVSSLPHVRSADVWGWGGPSRQLNTLGVHLPGEAPTLGEPVRSSRYHLVSPGAMERLGLQLLEGRWIEAGDEDGGPVAMVNGTLAEELWPNRTPLNRYLRAGGEEDTTSYRVVGVVADARHGGRIDARPEAGGRDVYFPWYRSPTFYFWLVVESEAAPEALEAEVRATVERAAPRASVTLVETLEAGILRNETPLRAAAAAIGFFALLAMLQAAAGLYAASGYFAEARLNELAVRRALGASSRRVAALFVAEGMTLTWVGLAIGFLAALSGRALILRLTYAVGFFDLASLASTVAGLTAAGGLAVFLPVRHLTRRSFSALLRT